MQRRFGVSLGRVALLCGVCLGCASSADVQPGGSNAKPASSGKGGKSPASAGKSGSNAHGGSGGSPSTMPANGGSAGAGSMGGAGAGLAMNQCGLHTKYPGDEYCILPPPPDKGFQLHIGPSNYDNPEAQYILAAGQEITSSFTAVSGNDKDIYFYYRQFRMRPGAHHNIITGLNGGGFGMGGRIGTSNLLAEDSPPEGVIAPENMDVGIPLPPKTTIDVSLHSINTTDKPELRELWVNFWYVDPAKVKEPVEEMFQVGDPLFTILPGQDTVLGPYQCSLSGDGRMLWFYGHRHANNVQFTATRIRGGQRDVIYDAFNWEEPLVLEYSSTVKNPKPDVPNGIEGGWSGILDLKTGDTLEWQCHVVNNSGGILAFTNNTYTGEMCIMDSELVGVNCQ